MIASKRIGCLVTKDWRPLKAALRLLRETQSAWREDYDRVAQRVSGLDFLSTSTSAKILGSG